MPILSLAGYHLTYDDEFSDPAAFKTSLNGSVGYQDTFDYGHFIPSNKEAEYYVDPASGYSPFSVQNGELTITAQPTSPGQQTSGQPYTSGLISTENSFSQNQGYFEIRAKSPVLQGFWSAFWMLPSTMTYYPELDALENPSFAGNSSYWTYANTSDATKGGGFNYTGIDLSAAFHRYGVLWTASTITFYLDGRQVGPTLTTPASLTQKMYLLANLAVGGAGSWPGQPNGTPTAQYQIDYIRAYSADPNVAAVAQKAMSSPDGANATPTYGLSPDAPTTIIGGGTDTLILNMAEDAWQGDATFSISVDGALRGGPQIAAASNALGQKQVFEVRGNFGAGAHTVSINFLNDAYGGNAQSDRNLYLTSANIDGTMIPGATVPLLSAGAQSFGFTETASSASQFSVLAQADPLFDSNYYLANNQDVLAAGVNPLLHYQLYGAFEGRNPDAWFDASYYLAQNPDVKAAGVNPLLHYETYGWKEGRDPSLTFSTSQYLNTYADVKAAGVDPLLHYIVDGQSEGRLSFLTGGAQTADPLVVASTYDPQLGATIVPTGNTAAMQAAANYDQSGWQKGLNPNAYFDTNYYLNHNPDVAAAHVNPLLHYEMYGWKEGRNPSAAFSTDKYLAAYSDVQASGADPLLQYVTSGQAQGRTAFAV